MTRRLVHHLLLCLCLASSGVSQAVALHGAGGETATAAEVSSAHSGCQDASGADAGCPHGGGDTCLCAASGAGLVNLPQADRVLPPPVPSSPPVLTRTLPAHELRPLRPPC